MFKVISDEATATFRIKELDQEGNSVRTLPDVFKSQLEADAAVRDLESGDRVAPSAEPEAEVPVPATSEPVASEGTVPEATTPPTGDEPVNALPEGTPSAQ